MNLFANFVRPRSKFCRCLAACGIVFESAALVYAQRHPDSEKLVNQAQGLWNQGRYQDAAPLYERALAIDERTIGSEDPLAIRTRDSLERAYYNAAYHYQNAGDYANALQIRERALAFATKEFGPESAQTRMPLEALGDLYMEMGDYLQALSFHERSLALSEKHNWSDLTNLADVYIAMGDGARALQYLNRGLALVESEKDAENQKFFKHAMFRKIASAHETMGEYAQALPLREGALSLVEDYLGPQRVIAASGLTMEGKTYTPRTPNDKGLSLFVARALNELGRTHAAMGEYAKALPFQKRALVIWEICSGSQDSDTAFEGMRNLAQVYAAMGEHEKALHLYQRSVKILEDSDAQSLEVITALSDLANLYTIIGDSVEARSLHERGLAIAENRLGSQHPKTATILGALARLTYQIGDLSASRNYASRQVAAKHRELQSILMLDEMSRLSWQRANSNYWFACMMRPEPLAQLLLRRKGVVLDSLLEDRALALSSATDTKGRQNIAQIVSLRAKLAKIAFDKDAEDEATKLQEQIAQLQRSLATRTNIAGRARRSSDVTIDEITPALAGGGAVIDFIRFTDPKRKDEESAGYGAIITGSDGSPSFARIDGATVIDNAIDALRSAIGQGQAEEVEAQTKFLSEKLWQPVAAKIPEGTKQLILCPDAKLNFLSFGTLLESDGSFVAEKYPISYIGSGRDLVRKPKGESAKQLVVFADPVFDTLGQVSQTEDMVAMRSAEADVFGAINLPPLPGTKAEAEQLEVIAAGAGWDIKTTTGDEATESSVRGAKKPGVLHLATHGFYLNSFSPPAEDGTRGMSVVGLDKDDDEKQTAFGVDPMRASGVALTGAQQTLKLWSQRKAPDPQTDGILTAEEVASLNLDGTWLVTLSACETGVGEARSGEGVFGLRRAFMMAGAENLLMTLWPVADDTTASIMADFYKEALATGDAPGSLAKVQRDWLVKLREEKGLATAIREAGPFAMVMMTAPTHPPIELPPIAKLENQGQLASEPPTQSVNEPTGEKKSGWWPF